MKFECSPMTKKYFLFCFITKIKLISIDNKMFLKKYYLFSIPTLNSSNLHNSNLILISNSFLHKHSKPKILNCLFHYQHCIYTNFRTVN